MSRKTVLITGSSKGLGRELALEFAVQNYNVIIQGRDESALQEVETQIKEKGVECYKVVGELTRTEVIKELADISKREKIVILVNNVGIYLGDSLENISIEDLERVMAINFFVPAILTKQILSLFLEGGRGLIVNINSIAGKQGGNLETAYAASKHALKGFFDSLRLEVTAKGVRILDIYLGAMATQMTEKRKNPNLVMQPREVAKVIVKNCERYESLEIKELTIGRVKY